MGTVIFSLRDFYDQASEYVGIKSGLLLNRFQISEMLLDTFDEDFLRSDDLMSCVRLYSDELENMFRTIRVKIGNLPTISSTVNDYASVRQYIQNGISDDKWMGFMGLCFHYLDINSNLSNNELALILEKEGFPKELTLNFANIAIERKDESCIIIPETNEWKNCATPLSDLYDCEIKNEKTIDFLDQQFIDYIAVNGAEIENIHWRNFERFCAEYFRRKGYDVVLGPGRNDGGIDIRVFVKKDSSNPSIVIQCKRYAEKRTVSIETVKAFYADVIFENAQQGLIVTSSYIASGGKKIVDTRKYNISFAEKERIKKWAYSMWAYSK